MAKQRKRTNKKIPAKGRLKEMADQLWSLAVKSDWGGHCAMCGGVNGLNSHHIVPRQHTAVRYDLRNGICLCGVCHQFDRNQSPHQNAAGWMEWLAHHHWTIYQWYRENPRPEFTGQTTAWFYIEQIQNLKPFVDPMDFDRVVGVRFSAYLDELTE